MDKAICLSANKKKKKRKLIYKLGLRAVIGSTGTKATFEGKLRYLPIADKTFLHLFLFIYLFDFSFDTQQFFPRAKLKAPLKKKKKKRIIIYLFI